MCYATALRKDKQDNRIQGRIKQTLKHPERYTPYFHANGFKHPQLQIIPQEAPNTILAAQWGFIPAFGLTDPSNFYKNYNTLNAKAETVFTANSYKDAIRYQRCLILADGFWEPHHHQGVAYPFFCHYPKDTIFCFAGIYAPIAKDKDLYSCSILTVAANPQFEYIHNKKKRMPLVLDQDYEEAWLTKLSDPNIETIIAQGFTKTPIEAYPVSRKLYNKNLNTNSELAIAPVDLPDFGTQGSLF